MWQSSKAYPLAYCPPGRGLVVGCLYRGRCPRLLKVVPSRHRSACGMRVIWIPSRHQSACGFYFITDFTDWTDFTDFTVRGDCALMRPIGLGEYVTGICSRRVLAFPSDRLTHILPRQDIIRVQSSRMPHMSSDYFQAPSSQDRCLTLRSAAWRAVL